MYNVFLKLLKSLLGIQDKMYLCVCICNVVYSLNDNSTNPFYLKYTLFKIPKYQLIKYVSSIWLRNTNYVTHNYIILFNESTAQCHTNKQLYIKYLKPHKYFM